MLTTKDFTYHLPPELIAQSPAPQRDHSRLLVVDRRDGSLSHHLFFELPELLDHNTVLVRNNSKVIKARLFGNKPTGGVVEVLLNKKISSSSETESWDCLTKPGIKPGTLLSFPDSNLQAECTGFGAEDDYTRTLVFNQSDLQLLKTLDQIGHTPLPPYIGADDTSAEVANRYQTTYALTPGSVAAPTAGLHITPEVELALRTKGIEIHDLTLHVGLGTFLPVKTTTITEHHMHAEWFELDESTANALNVAKATGKKILAVGTTSVRTLETVAAQSTSNQLFSPQSRDTSISIYPPYQFQAVDQMITNFHLPESTLLMLVGAFVSRPQTDAEFETFASSLLGKVYREAIAKEYRFYSFGDAMMVL